MSVTAWRCALILLMLCPTALSAQADDVVFGPKLAPFGAAGMIGQQSPIACVLTLQHGQNDGVWIMGPLTTERISPAVEMQMLKDVRDRSDRNGKDEKARDYLLTHARQVKAEDLARVADRTITYANLFEQPARFRGAVVHLRGTLRFVRRFDPVLSLRNDPDIKNLYEAWISGPEDRYNKNPYVVLLSALPKGIEPNDEIKDIPVSVDAYFFKLLRYEARGSDPAVKSEWHLAPMLVARTLTVVPPTVEPDDPLSESMRNYILPLIVSSAFAVILVGGMLLLFFRRGDLAVNARLKTTRDAMFVDPSTTSPSAREPGLTLETPPPSEKSEN